MQRWRLEDIEKDLVILGLVILPFLAMGELSELFNSNRLSQTASTTPLWIKALRDAIVIGILSVAFAKVLLGFTLPSSVVMPLGFLFAVICSWCVGVTQGNDDPVLRVTVLMRWAVPIFLPFALKGKTARLYPYAFSRLTGLLFVLHFAVQLLQLSVVRQWGVSASGLSLRNPGIVFMPSTAAGFSTIAYVILNRGFTTTGRKLFQIALSGFMKAAALVSVVLTGSGTGFVVLAVVFIIEIPWVRKYFFVFGTTGAILSLLAFASLTPRGSYLSISGGTRLGIVAQAIRQPSLWGIDQGASTNAYVLLTSWLGEPAGSVVDSTVASVILNSGIVGLVFLLIAYGYVIAVLLHQVHSVAFKQTVIVLTLFSFSLIITEAYPIFFPASVVLAGESRRRNKLSIKNHQNEEVTTTRMPRVNVGSA